MLCMTSTLKWLNSTGDTTADPLRVNRVILVCGKHYYELHKERLRAKIDDVAILRVESLSPFPLQALQLEVAKYKNARSKHQIVYYQIQGSSYNL